MASFGAFESLIPTRFSCLVGHLSLSLLLFWTKDDNIKAGLPFSYTDKEYNQRNTELTALLCLTLVCFAIELFGFVRGASMFNTGQSLFSTSAHLGASIALSFYVVDGWPSTTYSIIFSVCNILPTMFEIVLIIMVVFLKVDS